MTEPERGEEPESVDPVGPDLTDEDDDEDDDAADGADGADQRPIKYKPCGRLGPHEPHVWLSNSRKNCTGTGEPGTTRFQRRARHAAAKAARLLEAQDPNASARATGAGAETPREG